MDEKLTKADITNIIIFLKRATLKGEESLTHALLIDRLQKMANSLEKPQTLPKEPAKPESKDKKNTEK